jgi:hypothetical protein
MEGADMFIAGRHACAFDEAIHFRAGRLRE